MAYPADTAVTTPDASTVAIAVLPLLHVPPEMAWESVEDSPIQAFNVPVIAEGVAVIVCILVV
jgi:hypothetical protein